MGTLCYLAPEMYTKKITDLKDYNTLSDMWSLGVIIYTLVSKNFPFEGTDEEIQMKIQTTDYTFEPKELWDQISSECKDLIENLLEPNLKMRLSAEQALNHAWFDSLK